MDRYLIEKCLTTYEYYCEIMDEQDKIIAFVNNTFVPQQTGTEG